VGTAATTGDKLGRPGTADKELRFQKPDDEDEEGNALALLV